MISNRLSLNQITVSGTDLESSFEFYCRLGLIPIVKSPHYARFIAPGNEATFSIHIAEKVNSTTIVYFEVENVDHVVDELKKKGFQFNLDPVDQRWQWREARLQDPDGHEICIYHAGKVRMNPDWRIPESKKEHLLTEVHFYNWLQSYKSAWENRSSDMALELFSEDATYYETPYDPPASGKQEILKYWQQVPNKQEDISFDFDIIHVFNNTGFCRWNARFTRKGKSVLVDLDGIFEVVFDKTGKCSIFREWWHHKET